MKTFSGGRNKQIDRKTAMGLATMNVLVTPGLGTLMAGRIFSGLFQLGFSVVGFLLLMKWFYLQFQSIFSGSQWGVTSDLKIGALLFGIGWLGSLWSSVRIVRAARELTVATPPKLDGSAN